MNWSYHLPLGRSRLQGLTEGIARQQGEIIPLWYLRENLSEASGCASRIAHHFRNAYSEIGSSIPGGWLNDNLCFLEERIGTLDRLIALIRGYHTQYGVPAVEPHYGHPASYFGHTIPHAQGILPQAHELSDAIKTSNGWWTVRNTHVELNVPGSVASALERFAGESGELARALNHSKITPMEEGLREMIAERASLVSRMRWGYGLAAAAVIGGAAYLVGRG